MSGYVPGDRRPITTRDRGWARAVASRIARTGISANAISTIGMIVGIGAGAALWATPHANWLFFIGAALVQFRLLANMLDGMVAVETETASRVGELYNEVPDRVADTAIFVGLGYAAGGDVVLGFATALAALFTAYLRAVGGVAGAPQDYCGPLAKPQRMFVVTLISLACGVVGAGDWPMWGLAFLLAGTLLTAARRLVRIAGKLRED